MNLPLLPVGQSLLYVTDIMGHGNRTDLKGENGTPIAQS
jgi:hypothetical protein